MFGNFFHFVFPYLLSQNRNLLFFFKTFEMIFVSDWCKFRHPEFVQYIYPCEVTLKREMNFFSSKEGTCTMTLYIQTLLFRYWSSKLNFILFDQPVKFPVLFFLFKVFYNSFAPCQKWGSVYSKFIFLYVNFKCRFPKQIGAYILM